MNKIGIALIIHKNSMFHRILFKLFSDWKMWEFSIDKFHQKTGPSLRRYFVHTCMASVPRRLLFHCCKSLASPQSDGVHLLRSSPECRRRSCRSLAAGFLPASPFLPGSLPPFQSYRGAPLRGLELQKWQSQTRGNTV